MTDRVGIAFAPRYNTGTKKDATGAFIPEARAFVRHHGGQLVLVDNRASKTAQRNTVLRALAESQNHDGICCADPTHEHRLQYVAFFCHGWAKGIQLGFDLGNVGLLGSLIANVSRHDVVVPLYCCSTASTTRQLLRLGKGPGGDGGFADELRDALRRGGASRTVVDAHVTVGHTTKNPHVRRFAGAWLDPGGREIVKPRAPLWRPWVRMLRAGTFRFDFPWMRLTEIHKRLESP